MKLKSLLFAICLLLLTLATAGNLQAQPIITTFAGTGTEGYNGDGIPATSAHLNSPYGVALDSAGNLYIADTYNQRIRVVGKLPTVSSISGVVCRASDMSALSGATVEALVAGSPVASTNTLSDGSYSLDLAEGTYDVKASYTGLECETIFTVSVSTGQITSGIDFSLGSKPPWPPAAGIIYTIAGNGLAGYSNDGGAAVSAKLNYNWAMDFDASGNLYFTDADNHRVRRVDKITGIITTVAGTGIPGYNGDGILASEAQLNWPFGLCFDSSGNLYIADRSNHRIRKVDTAGYISTVAGTGTPGYNGDDIRATEAQLYDPGAVATDSAGNLYIADLYNHRIRKVDMRTGIITTVAGTGVAGYNGDDIPADTAQLDIPHWVAFDASDNLYIAEFGGNRVRKVDKATGKIYTIAGTGMPGYNGDGIPATEAQLWNPSCVEIDASGFIYIADYMNNRIRQIDPATGIIYTVAGTGTAGFNGDNIPANTAQLCYPRDVALDVDGNLYIADTENLRIRVVGKLGADTQGPNLWAAEIGTPKVVKMGDTVTIGVEARDASGVASVAAEIKNADTEAVLANLILYDDGAHNDGATGDSYYANTWTVTTDNIDYYVDITAADTLGNVIALGNVGGFSTKPFVKTATILLVDEFADLYDKKGIPPAPTQPSAKFYKDALAALGYRHDVWRIQCRGAPDSALLNQYLGGIIVWAAPYANTCLEGGVRTPATQMALSSFLDNRGSKLFISGQDIAYALWEAAGGGRSVFLNDYLYADCVLDDSGYRSVSGFPGDPISDGLSFSITGGDGADNQYAPDVISALSPAVPILEYIVLPPPPAPPGRLILPSTKRPSDLFGRSRTQSQTRAGAYRSPGPATAGLRVEDKGKLVYLSFGFEAISAAADRTTLMYRVIKYLEPILQAPMILEVLQSPAVPTADNPVSISATLIDDKAVTGADLFYSIDDGISWTKLAMTQTPGTDTWITTIPGQPAATKLDYYISAYDADGNIGTEAPHTPGWPPADSKLALLAKDAAGDVSSADLDIFEAYIGYERTATKTTVYFRMVLSGNYVSTGNPQSENAYGLWLCTGPVRLGEELFLGYIPNVGAVLYNITTNSTVPTANAEYQIAGKTLYLKADVGPSAETDFAVARGITLTNLDSTNLPAANPTTVDYTNLCNAYPRTHFYCVPLTHTFAAGLGMISVPLKPINPEPSVALGIDPSLLKLARWKPNWQGDSWSDAGTYRFYPDAYVSQLMTDATMKLCPGFWLKLDAEKKVDFFGTLPPQNSDFTVHLVPGWNMIGTPYLNLKPWGVEKVAYNGTETDIETALSNGWLLNYLWGYNAVKGYQLVHSTVPDALRDMVPFNGYWILAFVECDLTLTAPPAGKSQPVTRKREKPTENQWFLRLVATAGNLRDSYNYAGVVGDTKGTKDLRYNILNPPSAGISPFVDLYFIEPSEPSQRFAALLKRPFGTKEIWDFEVTTDLADTDVVLTWPDLSQVPKKYRVVLVDKQTGTRKYMRTTSAYVYKSGRSGGTRRFQLIVEEAANSRLMITNIVATPFRAPTGGTTISYHLSQEALVDVKIYGLTGRLVRTVAVSKESRAGLNSVTWDGRDSNGLLIPNGIYLCQVIATTEEGQSARGVRTILVRK